MPFSSTIMPLKVYSYLFWKAERALQLSVLASSEFPNFHFFSLIEILYHSMHEMNDAITFLKFYATAH